MDGETKLEAVNAYFPAPGELSPASVQAQRDALEALLRPAFPDLDMRPNTPFGDLMLSPEAVVKAGASEALGRMLADMDLANLAAGRVNNAVFAREYLSNFGDFERKSIGSYGLVKLVFSENEGFDLPNHLRFKFNSPTASHEFWVVRSHEGDIQVKPEGTALPAGVDAFGLVREDANRYALYLPVNGISGDAILGGSPAFSSPELETTVSMEASGDIASGSVPEEVAELARLVLRTVFDSTFASRKSAESFAWHKMPDLMMAGATVSGDAEMQRATTNIVGLLEPCVDLYVRSSTLAPRSALVRLYYDAAGRFYGKLPFSVAIQELSSVSYPEDESVEVPLSSVRIMASPLSSKAPGASNGTQGSETLFLDFPMPVFNGSAAVPLDVDSYGNQYAEFAVEVLCDPAVEIMQKLAYADGTYPLGSSLRVRPYVYVVVDEMRIRYRRAANMSPSLEDAEELIVDTMHRFGYYRPYSPGPINDIMEAAGATQVVQLLFDYHVEYSAAAGYLPPGVSALPETHALLVAGLEVPSAYQVYGATSPEPAPAGPGTARAVVGLRNLCYVLREGAVAFEEVSD
jgi:hypothetical protein